MRFPVVGQVNSRIFIPFAIIVAGAILFLLRGITILNPVISPINKIFFQASNVFSSSPKDLGQPDLALENELLIEEVRNLKIENAVLRTQVEENELLRQQLNFTQNYQFNYVTAAILSRGIDRAFDQVIIDRGSADGIKPGMPVIFGDGLLLGKVAAVQKSISNIRLISDQLSKVAVSIQNNGQTVGVLEGSFGLSTKVELIPGDVEIEPGQIVVTSGLDPFVPAGLIVGEIERVEKKTNEFFQTAYVRPLVQLSEPSIVSVIVTE
ncbi:MAG: rod shape-determining protein MreC [Candidatus Buchananbacteria bacterium CG10_big_fil_rev_8_21_14_0_10_42_9]|uniref:Cell shape-determining protein MreC n=1 Tax=Candidatus Buchananbacteria bacterium CG10_big_fil_rev_8_21_14_0_10_42_9 TaxID=1974526 RepID=A0A2H0W2B3_9BACT|nr:MAG: rod shape-determining protein MreC [Candidatus Buchananbacteria bacterium CG10_big_fil_rev_8_21_14_0_10_42_9]